MFCLSVYRFYISVLPWVINEFAENFEFCKLESLHGLFLLKLNIEFAFNLNDESFSFGLDEIILCIQIFCLFCFHLSFVILMPVLLQVDESICISHVPLSNSSWNFWRLWVFSYSNFKNSEFTVFNFIMKIMKLNVNGRKFSHSIYSHKILTYFFVDKFPNFHFPIRHSTRLRKLENYEFHSTFNEKQIFIRFWCS